MREVSPSPSAPESAAGSSALGDGATFTEYPRSEESEEKHVRRNVLRGAALLLVTVAAVGAVAGAGASHKASTDVCVLLPDTKSSVRWVQFDKPAMAAA